MTKKSEDIFDNFSRHVRLSQSEATRIRTELKAGQVEKNTILLAPGRICRDIFYVESGCLRLFYTDDQGAEHNIMFCPEGWWAADMQSFSSQTPAFYQVEALEDSKIMSIGYYELEGLYIAVPKLERFFRILTQNGFSLYLGRVNSNLSKTAEERYMMFREQYPGLEQRITQKQIASYLGITPVFLSRIRKRLM